MAVEAAAEAIVVAAPAAAAPEEIGSCAASRESRAFNSAAPAAPEEASCPSRDRRPTHRPTTRPAD